MNYFRICLICDSLISFKNSITSVKAIVYSKSVDDGKFQPKKAKVDLSNREMWSFKSDFHFFGFLDFAILNTFFVAEPVKKTPFNLEETVYLNLGIKSH